MKKIAYNLARDRRVHIGAFAWRAAALAAVALLLAALALANLAQQREIDLRAGVPADMLAKRIARMQKMSDQLQAEIDKRKKTRAGELATANSLIERKSFSHIARLDRLESAFLPGVRLRSVTLANQAVGRVAMTVSAQSLRDLFALYKNLAAYDLVISNESQAQDEYLVNLSIRFDHEKM